jgi:uncharacterized membrane protein
MIWVEFHLHWFIGPRKPLESRSKSVAHHLFWISILLKGVDGAFELILGAVLIFVSPDSIGGFLFYLLRGELKEDPLDPLTHFLVVSLQTLTAERSSAASFLTVHGIAKLALVIGLLSGRMWSYPIAIVVFAAFGLFQSYQLMFQYSPLLLVLTLIDLVVVVLIAEEYRIVRAARRHRSC